MRNLRDIMTGSNRYNDQDHLLSNCVSPGWILPFQMRKFDVTEVLKAQKLQENGRCYDENQQV